MRKRIAAGLAALGMAGLLSGCGAELAGAVYFDMVLADAKITVPRGGSGEVEVALVRFSPIGLDVAIGLENPPKGVSAAPLNLSSGVSTGKLRLSVASEVKAGGPIKLKVKGSNPVVTKTADLELTVTEAKAQD